VLLASWPAAPQLEGPPRARLLIRFRCLDSPTAASSASITPSRSHSSLIAASPAFAVSAASGVPIRGYGRFRLLALILTTR
jgi:hypothetical protein